MNYKSTLLIAIFFIAVAITGCKKDQEECSTKDQQKNCINSSPEEVLDCINGGALMQIREYFWTMDIIHTDTSYLDTVYFNKIGSSVSFAYPPDNLEWTLRFEARDSIEKIDTYSYGNTNSYFQNILSRMQLYYAADSLFLSHFEGFLGGGTTWEIKGKRIH